MIGKIWKSGTSLVITLSQATIQYYGLKEGDIIEFEILNQKSNQKADIRKLLRG